MQTSVADVIINKQWVFPPLVVQHFPRIVQEIKVVTIPLVDVDDVQV